MSNGSRRFIFAIVGWLALIGASSQPQPSTQPNQTKTSAEPAKGGTPAATAPVETPKPVDANEASLPCGQREYDSNNDLCAQWKAADAARDAADWAWWQLGLSFMGVVGLGWTLWFNFRALRIAEESKTETRNALKAAQDNAKAANRAARAASESNEIAREGMQRQLRPYVHVENIEPRKPEPETEAIVVTVKNYGATPATDIFQRFGFLIGPVGFDQWPVLKNKVRLSRDMAPGGTQKAIMSYDDDWRQDIEAVVNGKAQMNIVLSIDYEGYGIETETITVCCVLTHKGPYVPVALKIGDVTEIIER